MPLHFTQPPAAATQALMAAVPGLAAKPSLAIRTPALAAIVGTIHAAPSDANLSENAVPAPVHVVGLDMLAAGGDARKAPLAVWTYLLHTGGGAVPTSLADVDAHTMKFAAVTEGEHIRALGANLRAAESSAAQGGSDFDVAMIRVPALYLSAVWLKGRGGADDVIIPGESPKSPLTAGKRYTPAEFNSALKAVAAKELLETDPLKGG